MSDEPKADPKQKELHPHSPDIDMPEAKRDDPPRAPGGVDAVAEESDVGEGEHPQGLVVTPDQPLAAQTDEQDVPDEIQEPEEEDEADESTSDRPEESPTESPG